MVALRQTVEDDQLRDVVSADRHGQPGHPAHHRQVGQQRHHGHRRAGAAEGEVPQRHAHRRAEPDPARIDKGRDQVPGHRHEDGTGGADERLRDRVHDTDLQYREPERQQRRRREHRQRQLQQNGTQRVARLGDRIGDQEGVAGPGTDGQCQYRHGDREPRPQPQPLPLPAAHRRSPCRCRHRTQRWRATATPPAFAPGRGRRRADHIVRDAHSRRAQGRTATARS